MSEVAEQARLMYGYAAELWQDRAHFGQLLGQVTDQAGLAHIAQAQNPLGIAGMGLLTKMAYDVSRTGGEAPFDTGQRLEVADIGCLGLLAADLVDDEIDRAEVPVNEKFRCLDLWEECLIIGRDTMVEGDYPVGTKPQGIRVSQDIARYLHRTAADYGRLDALVGVVDELFVDLKAQISSTDLDEQLQLVANIGRGCGELSAVAVDIVDGVEHPKVTTALGALGVYAECVNHGSEIIANQAEGSASYANLLFEKQGYNPAVHRKAKRALYQAGEVDLQQGIRTLDKDGQRIVIVGKHLMDIKYKLLGKRAKPKAPQPVLATV